MHDTTEATDAAARPRARLALRLVPAALISASAVLLFGLHTPVSIPAGYLLLGLALTTALVIDRPLARDLALIALGLLLISTISLAANIDYPNMALMGAVLTLAVLLPYLVSRYLYRERAIRFPIRTGRPWTSAALGYLVVVIALGYAILPTYFIRSGAFHNWPTVTAPDEIGRLFVGVGFVGIWDELFFICTVFALLRRHFPDWLANLLQAVIFTSFLWELGYRSWGPLITFPFALLQGFTFALTRSLGYVIVVHLLFDLVVFLVIVHAHTPAWLPIFLY
ncbi:MULTISPECIES: CPBP family intramembrane glutamic endopeptidase [Cryobacterium]|uniref:CPBP family intramembrane metalloprotease n=2 Tax=Bacteria TaxID=2 RepID=A0ABY2IK38_9MICO|nr:MULTISPECIES: CPBP family intramembrane glutamic endopeptidase [Cryobacterium]TFB93734.1 CPBP family intramembrane metalloprotease [Cryobacterium sp. MDB2-A-1]TFC14300.1 CPBP family intramembrane metalloprotease [Cryobacterium sp. MDB2-10]TFC14834.1 CPBP family intramembrane metalloprotease [Cryobacterium sp. MDB2-A-2]TFC18331.1 CPBP family intramembrane metalloprotease [Cryobacterium glucosi]